MSSRRFIVFTLFFLAFSSINDAKASLYGFVNLHPFDDETELKEQDHIPVHIINYRDKMRENILFLIRYAKSIDTDFATIVNGGEDLLHIDEIEVLTENYNKINSGTLIDEDENGATSREFDLINAIDGISSPNALCGDNCDFKEVHTSGLRKIYIEKSDTKEQLEKAIRESTENDELLYSFKDVDEAYKNIKGELIINENAKNIFNLSSAKNISIITDDSKYNNKFDLIRDINSSNYDIVIINPLFHDKIPYTVKEIESLKLKRNGLKRMIIAEMNISEANPNKYYYKREWRTSRPDWMKRASFSDPDGIIVEYWNEEWRDIIAKFFKDIVGSKYDGVWLTGAENYKYFERLTPLK